MNPLHFFRGTFLFVKSDAPFIIGGIFLNETGGETPTVLLLTGKKRIVQDLCTKIIYRDDIHDVREASKLGLALCLQNRKRS
jgi:hypothetical protein